MWWKILIIMDNVYKGFSFIVCLTIVPLIFVVTRPHFAGPHQAIVSIYWVELFVPTWLLVIGVSQTSLMVDVFRSNVLLALWKEKTDPSAVRCGRGRMLCCLIVGIHASGISIPLCLLILWWSLMCHSLRKCSRDQKLWSTDLAETWHRSWLWRDISKATLAQFWEF